VAAEELLWTAFPSVQASPSQGRGEAANGERRRRAAHRARRCTPHHAPVTHHPVDPWPRPSADCRNRQPQPPTTSTEVHPASGSRTELCLSGRTPCEPTSPPQGQSLCDRRMPVVNHEELTAALASGLLTHDSNSHAVVQRGLSPPPASNQQLHLGTDRSMGCALSVSAVSARILSTRARRRRCLATDRMRARTPSSAEDNNRRPKLRESRKRGTQHQPPPKPPRKKKRLGKPNTPHAAITREPLLRCDATASYCELH
jgi:hypothetical protein